MMQYSDNNLICQFYFGDRLTTGANPSTVNNFTYLSKLANGLISTQLKQR